MVYIAAATLGFMTYILSSVFVYMGERELERSLAATRANIGDQESAIGLSEGCTQPDKGKNKQHLDNDGGLAQSVHAKGFGHGEAEDQPKGDSTRSGRSKQRLMI